MLFLFYFSFFFKFKKFTSSPKIYHHHLNQWTKRCEYLCKISYPKQNHIITALPRYKTLGPEMNKWAQLTNWQNDRYQAEHGTNLLLKPICIWQDLRYTNFTCIKLTQFLLQVWHTQPICLGHPSRYQKQKRSNSFICFS